MLGSQAANLDQRWHLHLSTYPRRSAEQLNNVNPVGSYEPPVKHISGHGSMSHTCSKEPILDNSSEATCAPLPSSFTSLLFESRTNIEEEPPKAPETLYLNNQVMGGMTDSKFLLVHDFGGKTQIHKFWLFIYNFIKMLIVH